MKNEVKKEKSGGEVAKQVPGTGSELAASSSPEKAKASPGKTDPRYWQPRLYRPAYTREGKRVEVQTWAVRLQHAGRREEFNLDDNDRTRAASKARDRFVFLKANGWAAAVVRFKPKPSPKIEVVTVGDVIKAASKVAVVKPASLRFYVNALRLVAADLAKIKADSVDRTDRKSADGMPGNPRLRGIKSGVVHRKASVRSAYRAPEFIAWRASVDAVPLATITPERVAIWRATRIAAKTDPLERASAKVTADSIIRGAKALFGRRILPHLARELALPAVLPFAGIAVAKSAKRFRAEVSAPWIFTAASNDLREKLPEQWKGFVLCLLGGLRKAEADCLTWAQLNLEAGRIEIRKTAHFSPKSAESERDVELSDDALEIMRKFREIAEVDAVFVLRGGPARPSSRFGYYRADRAPWRTWQKLGAWLQTKGITAKKPVHALRKLAGSVIHEAFGIEAARDFLGHADIATTSASYLSKKPRVAITLAEDSPRSVPNGGLA